MSEIRAFEFVEVVFGRARIPGRYTCGCPLRIIGWDCPKMSCANKFDWYGGKDPLHSENYDTTLPW